MESVFRYPTIEQMIECNTFILNTLKVKRADRAAVLNRNSLLQILKRCRETEGDVYVKGIVLLKGIIQQHPFASGNRRTTFVMTKEFIRANGGIFSVEDDPAHARTLQGIRENFYMMRKSLHGSTMAKSKNSADREAYRLSAEELAQVKEFIDSHRKLLEAIGRL